MQYKTFLFIQRNGDAIITLSAPTFEEAEESLALIVKDPTEFRVEDEEGESE